MPRYNTPSRFQSGINAYDPRDLLADSVSVSMPTAYTYRFRGNGAEAPSFVNTIATTGTAVMGNAVLGGGWLLTTAATLSDTVQSQLAGAAFQFVPGFPCWYQARVEVDDISLAEFVHGVQETNTSALAATDGIWFHKASGGTTVDLVTAIGGVLTTHSAVIDLGTLFAGGTYTANLTGGAVTSITVNQQPTGIYAGMSALVTLTGGAGSGATAIAYVGNGNTLTFQVLAGGSGYTSSPAVALIPQVPMGFFYDGNATLYYGFGGRKWGSVASPALTPSLLSPVVELKASTAAARVLNYADLVAGGRLPY